MLKIMTIGDQLAMMGNNILSTEKGYTSPFDPTQIAGNILWLDAGQGVLKDGSNYVYEWDDMSGNHNNAISPSDMNKLSNYLNTKYNLY